MGSLCSFVYAWISTRTPHYHQRVACMYLLCLTTSLRGRWVVGFVCDRLQNIPCGVSRAAQHLKGSFILILQKMSIIYRKPKRAYMVWRQEWLSTENRESVGCFLTGIQEHFAQERKDNLWVNTNKSVLSLDFVFLRTLGHFPPKTIIFLFLTRAVIVSPRRTSSRKFISCRDGSRWKVSCHYYQWLFLGRWLWKHRDQDFKIIPLGLFDFYLLEILMCQGMVAKAFNPSTWEAEVWGQPALHRALDQPWLHHETVSKTKTGMFLKYCWTQRVNGGLTCSSI